MKKNEEKIGFDLSLLSLEELLDCYTNICDFLQFLEENKLETEEKETSDD